MRSVKGYFFLFDAIAAVMILTAGYLLIISANPAKPAEIQAKHISRDIMGLLATVKVDDLCRNCGQGASCACTNYLQLQTLCQGNLIRNCEYTLLELIGDLESQPPDYSLQIGSLLSELLPSTIFRTDLYGFRFLIQADPAVPASMTERYQTSSDYQDSKLLIASKRIVFGYWEDPGAGTFSFWGPLIVEVQTWQR